MEKQRFDRLLESGDVHLKKLHEIVLNSIKEEDLIAQLLYEKKEKTSLAERLADNVASFGGSWKFIISFFLFMLVWICANVWWLQNKGFDPYPFILLNLLLSCIAAIQAPIIMMSQNRKEARDRKRSENDYVINLKAEIEIRNLHEKIDLLMVEQMENLFDVQKAQMELIREIKQTLSNR